MAQGIFEVYPNPTTELINFKRFMVDKAEAIEIVNLEGNWCAEQPYFLEWIRFRFLPFCGAKAFIC